MQPCHLQQSCPLRKTPKRNESVRHPAPYFEGEVVILISKPCLPSKSKPEAEETHRSLWWFFLWTLTSFFTFINGFSLGHNFSWCWLFQLSKISLSFQREYMKDFELYDNENWCASVEQGKKFLRVLTQMENWSNSSTQQQLYYTTTPLPLYIPFWYMATIKTWQSSSM